MPFRRIPERGAYEPRDIEIMVAAFEKALRLADITDRTSLRAELIARSVVAQFDKGEDDARRIARVTVAN